MDATVFGWGERNDWVPSRGFLNILPIASALDRVSVHGFYADVKALLIMSTTFFMSYSSLAVSMMSRKSPSWIGKMLDNLNWSYTSLLNALYPLLSMIDPTVKRRTGIPGCRILSQVFASSIPCLYDSELAVDRMCFWYRIEKISSVGRSKDALAHLYIWAMSIWRYPMVSLLSSSKINSSIAIEVIVSMRPSMFTLKKKFPEWLFTCPIQKMWYRMTALPSVPPVAIDEISV